MKTPNLSLVFAVLLVSSASKVFSQQPAWLFTKQNNYVESYVDYSKVLISADNHFVVTGSGRLKSATTFDADFVIRKKDLNGVVVWEKQYGGSGEEQLISTVKTDEGYFLAGISKSEKSRDITSEKIGDDDVWIIKLNLQGDILWEKRLGSIYFDKIGNIIALSSGGVLIVGGKGVPSQGNNPSLDFWTVNLDKDGVIIWDKSFLGSDAETFLEQYFTDVIVDPAGGFIGVGYDDVITSRTNGISIYSTPTFVKISSQGDKQSIQNFGLNFSTDYQPFSGFDHIKRLSNGDILVFGSEYDGNGGTSIDIVLRRYNAAGTQLINRKMFGGNKRDKVVDIVETSEGGYLAVGSSESTTGGSIIDINKGDLDGIVLKLNSEFEVQWSRLIGSQFSDKLSSIIKLDSDNYVIAGLAGDPTLPASITTRINPVQGTTYSGAYASLFWISNQTSADTPDQVSAFTVDNINACGAMLTWTTDPEVYGYIVSLDGKIVYAGQNSTLRLNLAESTSYQASVLSLNYSLAYSDKKEIMFETSPNIQDRLGYNKLLGSVTSDYVYAGMVIDDSGNFVLVGNTEHNTSYGGVNDIASSSAGYYDGLAVAFDAQGKKLWDKVFGGSNLESFFAVLLLNDGYLFGGVTNSETIAGVTEPKRGGNDFFVVKTNKQGVTQWMHRYGGEQNETIAKMVATTDGGFILAGTTNSPIGNDLSQEKFSVNSSDTDVWIIKINQNGVKQWDRRLGGTSGETLGDLIYYPTGELRVFLNTFSSNTGNIDIPRLGSQDIWSVLLTSTGEPQISHRWGGSQNSNTTVTKVFERDNGNRVIIGTTNTIPASTGAFTAASYGGLDYFILELDFMNQPVRNFRFGGNQGETLNNVIMTQDGGYLLSGYSISGTSGQKSEAARGDGDVWIVRVNANGEVLWEKTYGSSAFETVQTIIPGNGNYYWLAGYALSNGGCDLPKGRGITDIWLMKQFDEALTSPPAAVTGLTSSFIRSPDKAVIDWNAPTPEQRINYFKIYRDGEFIKTTQNDSTHISGTFEPEFYSFEVSAVNFARLEGEKSSTILDLSIILSSETSSEKREALEAYPVPFTKQLIIRARSGSLRNNKIQIISLSGELLQSVNINHVEEGYEYYLVNGNELANGIYLYRAQTIEGFLSGKIIKQ